MGAASRSATLELRSSPALAEVLHFARTFGPALRQPPFPAERLEAALLSPAAHEFPRWFFSLIFALSRPAPTDEEQRGFAPEPDPDVVWEQILIERLAALHAEGPESENPLGGSRSWFDLTALQRVRECASARRPALRARRVPRPLRGAEAALSAGPTARTQSNDPPPQAEILRSLCLWRLEELTDDLVGDTGAAELRAVPVGSDSDGAVFFWFGTEDCFVFRHAAFRATPQRFTLLDLPTRPSRLRPHAASASRPLSARCAALTCSHAARPQGGAGEAGQGQEGPQGTRAVVLHVGDGVHDARRAQGVGQEAQDGGQVRRRSRRQARPLHFPAPPGLASSALGPRAVRLLLMLKTAARITGAPRSTPCSLKSPRRSSPPSRRPPRCARPPRPRRRCAGVPPGS